MTDFLPGALEGGAVALLALMCYQDWHSRSISWPAFPALAVLLLSRQLLALPVSLVGLHTAVNWALTGLLLGLYVRWRFRHSGVGLWDCLGYGDALYWAVVAVYFPPAGFLLYFLLSALAALLSALAWQVLRPAAATRAYQVPLAGLQAAALLLLLSSQWVFPGWPYQWARTAGL